MKAIIKSVMALLVLCAFTACSDVPMPYEEPGSGSGDEPSTTTEPKGSGTAADPYNVAAALQVVNALAAGEETPTAIYVKGAVKEIRQIETAQYGNANYYITDDGNNQIYIFQSYYLGNRKFTASDKLEVGDSVVVYGKFTNYQGNTPETVGRGTSYIYSLNGNTAGGDTPQPPTTNTGLNATFATGDEGFTIKDISLSGTLTFVWKYDATNKYMKAGAYKDGVNNPAQSMIVSPAFSLEGLTTATLTYDQTAKYLGNAAEELQVLASTDGTNWTRLNPSAYPDGNSWDFVNTTCDMSVFAGKKTVYVAFQYTSTADAAPTWEVKNVVVK